MLFFKSIYFVKNIKYNTYFLWLIFEIYYVVKIGLYIIHSNLLYLLKFLILFIYLKKFNFHVVLIHNRIIYTILLNYSNLKFLKK